MASWSDINKRRLTGVISAVDLPPVITAYGLNSRAVRVVDVVGASTGLIFFGPILLIVALAIKIDLPGPVFVRETQYGSRNRRIEVLKFRLVTTGAQGDQRRPCPTWIGASSEGAVLMSSLDLLMFCAARRPFLDLVHSPKSLLLSLSGVR